MLIDVCGRMTNFKENSMVNMLKIKTSGKNFPEKFKKRALTNIIVKAADNNDAVNNNNCINKLSGDARRGGTKRKIDTTNAQTQATKMPRFVKHLYQS